MKAMQKGFTLIELMITVVIIGILASIAIPQYADHVIRAKLQEGTSALAASRVKMEQYYMDNRTYASSGVPAATANFTYALSSLGTTSYIITATGRAGGSVSNFTYNIDQTNTKQTTSAKTGWGTTPANCWHIKKGGSC
jgi:type IV pilus assembly protein PilE